MAGNGVEYLMMQDHIVECAGPKASDDARWRKMIKKQQKYPARTAEIRAFPPDLLQSAHYNA